MMTNLYVLNDRFEVGKQFDKQMKKSTVTSVAADRGLLG